MAVEIEAIDHSGLPLPSAAEFSGYELTCPGAADRILTLAEKQFEHRAELEKIQQKSDNEFFKCKSAVSLNDAMPDHAASSWSLSLASTPITARNRPRCFSRPIKSGISS